MRWMMASFRVQAVWFSEYLRDRRDAEFFISAGEHNCVSSKVVRVRRIDSEEHVENDTPRGALVVSEAVVVLEVSAHAVKEGGA